MSVLGPRVLRVGLDGRSLQGGFREDSGRGIGVYARELMRTLAVRRDLALTLWLEPALPAVPPGFVPPGVTVRHYARVWLPMRDRLTSQLTVPAAAGSRLHDVFHWLAHVHAPAFPPRCSVLTVHDLILEQLAPLYAKHKSLGYKAARKLEAMAIHNASVLVADSHATRDDLLARHKLAPERVHVAPLGVNARFAPAGAVEVAAVRKYHNLTAPFVLYLGGIDARKDIPMLLEAFAQVLERRSEPLLLVLAGHVLKAPEYPGVDQARARAGLAGRDARAGVRAVEPPRHAAHGGARVRVPVALRGLRAAAARGDGVRHAGGEHHRRLAGRSARRCRADRVTRRRGRVRVRTDARARQRAAA